VEKNLYAVVLRPTVCHLQSRSFNHVIECEFYCVHLCCLQL